MKINLIAVYDGNMNSGVTKKLIAQAEKITETGNRCQLYLLSSKIDDLNKRENITQIKFLGSPFKSIIHKIKALTYIREILTQLFSTFKEDEIILFRNFFPFWFFSNLIEERNVFIELVSNCIQEAKIRKSYAYLILYLVFRGGIGNKVKGVIGVTKEVIKINFPKLNREIPTLAIGNGFDVSSVNLSKRFNSKFNNINFTCVANVSKWHGLDRFLNGLAEYKGKIYCVFHVVGNGEELNNLKILTTELGISDKVIFHGEKSGKDLDEIFKITDIGVGNLGTFRKNITMTSPLKSREYCARGIPFFYTCRDEDFPQEFPFALEIEAKETPIDIDQLIDFYREISKVDEYRLKMRDFAKENLSWNTKMVEIVSFMISNSKKI